MQFKSNPLQKYKRVAADALRYLLAIFSSSLKDHLLNPSTKPTHRKCFQTVWSPTASISETQKQEPHGRRSTAARGMLAATSKRALVGFMKLEAQKFTIKRPHTEGVSSLASVWRKRSREKQQHLQ